MQKKGGKSSSHPNERKAAVLFIIAVFLVAGLVLLRDPRVEGYATAENKVKVINEESYVPVNSEWEIRFTAQGSGDLEISEIRESFYDLSGLEVMCDEQKFPYNTEGGKITVKDYSCDGVGKITSRVIGEGKQTLKISLGNKDYATNTARKENI